MFILVQLKDTIRIPPEDAALLNRDPLHVLRTEINSLYCNKIIPDIGQCILVHSILSFDDPFLWPSDAGPYIHCIFRVVVYQAQEGEIVQAKVCAASEEKLVLSTEFFSNIIIEASQLPPGSHWNAEEKVWIWNNQDAEYFIETGAIVRSKILSSKFSTSIDPNVAAAEDSTANPRALKYGYVRPTPPLVPAVLPPTASGTAPVVQKANYVAPLTIYGSFISAGLGPLEWWE